MSADDDFVPSQMIVPVQSVALIMEIYLSNGRKWVEATKKDDYLWIIKRSDSFVFSGYRPAGQERIINGYIESGCRKIEATQDDSAHIRIVYNIE